MKEYSITWFIENYSHCWHKIGDKLVSPEFTADSLKDTNWTLELYPRGIADILKGHISLFLTRSNSDDGPEELPLKYEISVLAADRSTLNCGKYEYTYKKGSGFGSLFFLKMDGIFLRKNFDYLPQDTLTVQFNIWMGERNTQQIQKIDVRTRIGTKQVSFIHGTASFSTLESNQKKTIDIRSLLRKGLDLTCSLYFTDDSWCEGMIIVEITPNDVKQILSRCNVYLLDASEKLIPCGEADNRFDAEIKDIKKLPLSLKRQVILERKSEYLPDDKLTLLFECTFSTGVEYENIETILHEMPVMALKQLNDNHPTRNFYEERLSKCRSGLDELREIYNNQSLTDLEFRTKTKSFPVHKLVLSARSSVFKAMLTNDMKEKNTNCIQVDDLDNDTVHLLLLFLYSDNLENLQWESAVKLYYAGDKYAIEKLKVLCSSFLTKHLTTSTASELLLLADTHNDCDLKKFVEDFIFKHEKQVFGSDEWKNLIETNPALVSKTMCLKYLS